MKKVLTIEKKVFNNDCDEWKNLQLLNETDVWMWDWLKRERKKERKKERNREREREREDKRNGKSE